MNIEEVFEKYDDEYLEFDRIELKLCRRRDIHAFLLLEHLCPGSGPVVAAAAHDEIYLQTDPEKLAAVATEDQIRDLIRCGIRLDEDGLCMFV